MTLPGEDVPAGWHVDHVDPLVLLEQGRVEATDAAGNRRDVPAAAAVVLLLHEIREILLRSERKLDGVKFPRILGGGR